MYVRDTLWFHQRFSVASLRSPFLHSLPLPTNERKTIHILLITTEASSRDSIHPWFRLFLPVKVYVHSHATLMSGIDQPPLLYSIRWWKIEFHHTKAYGGIITIAIPTLSSIDVIWRHIWRWIYIQCIGIWRHLYDRINVATSPVISSRWGWYAYESAALNVNNFNNFCP